MSSKVKKVSDTKISMSFQQMITELSFSYCETSDAARPCTIFFLTTEHKHSNIYLAIDYQIFNHRLRLNHEYLEIWVNACSKTLSNVHYYSTFGQFVIQRSSAFWKHEKELTFWKTNFQSCWDARHKTTQKCFLKSSKKRKFLNVWIYWW